MRIETQNSVHESYNPAWRAAENLRKWCEEIDLHPNTVKPFSTLNQVVERTALGRVFPLTSVELYYLTPKERQLIAGNPPEISQMPKLAIVDIDGVLVGFWSTLAEFWRGHKYDSPSLREAIERKKPSWTSLLPLGDIARRVDKLILWTSRFSPEEESFIWKFAQPLFGNLGSFDAFPFLSQAKAQKVERRFFPGKTQVIAGKIKGLSKSGFDQVARTIEKLGDPYIVYIGSSLFDIRRFKGLINFLRKKEDPFDRFVLCANAHLVL